jgi:hypothetical protein
MPLLLVKPLRGLGALGLDLEPSIEPDMNLRMIGLVMGRQAFGEEISIKTKSAVNNNSHVTHKR